MRNVKRRIVSIDFFRGALLMIMVIEHCLLYFGDESAVDNWLYCFFNDGISGWGAGGFLMMMGASQALSAGRMNQDDRLTMFKKALLRGAFLFVVGLVMLMVSFGPSDVWRWDILTLMGFSTVLLFFCRFLPTWSLVAFVAAIAVLTPALRGMPVMDFEWDIMFRETPFLSRFFPGMYIDPVSEPDFLWRLDHIFKGFFLWGEFPIFPWVLFSVMGFIAGRRIVSGKFVSDIPRIVAVGIVLVTLSFAGAGMGRSQPLISVVDSYITPFCFYPDSFTMIIYQIGLSLLVFSLLFYIFDVKGRGSDYSGPVARVLRRTSNSSLTFYFLHYMLIGWPLLIAHALTGRDYEMDFMGLVPSFLYGLFALFLLQLLLLRWEKIGGKYSLEWLLTILLRRVVKDYRRSV